MLFFKRIKEGVGRLGQRFFLLLLILLLAIVLLIILLVFSGKKEPDLSGPLQREIDPKQVFLPAEPELLPEFLSPYSEELLEGADARWVPLNKEVLKALKAEAEEQVHELLEAVP